MTVFDCRHRRGYRLLFSVALAVSLLPIIAGCGGKPPKVEPPAPAPPRMLRVDVSAAINANATASAQGRPIVVRLYELKSAGAFSRADFFSLYDREAEVLGDDLVAREEMTLAPGQDRRVSKALGADTRYLGIVGAYRDIDRAQWRKTVPLRGDDDRAVFVSIGPDAISVESL